MMSDLPGEGSAAGPDVPANEELPEAASQGFTREQLVQLSELFATLQRQMRLPGELISEQPQDPEEPPVQEKSNVKEWNPEEIGFFDPDYEGSGPVVNRGKSVFYRDVYAFIDRLKDMTHVRGLDKLRSVIPQTLRGSALIWHSTELSELEKRLLRKASLDEWEESLIERFKERVPIALAKLQTAKYTMNDARERRDPRAFVQDFIRYAKAANLTSVLNQLSMAWYSLDWEFRIHISEPTERTTIKQFLAQLNGKADMWYEMAQRQRSHGGTGRSLRNAKRKQPRQERDSSREANFESTFDRLYSLVGESARPSCSSRRRKTHDKSFSKQPAADERTYQKASFSSSHTRPEKDSEEKGKKRRWKEKRPKKNIERVPQATLTATPQATPPAKQPRERTRKIIESLPVATATALPQRPRGRPCTTPGISNDSHVRTTPTV